METYLLFNRVLLGTTFKLEKKNKNVRLCRILVGKSFAVKEVCAYPVLLKLPLIGKYLLCQFRTEGIVEHLLHC